MKVLFHSKASESVRRVGYLAESLGIKAEWNDVAQAGSLIQVGRKAGAESSAGVVLDAESLTERCRREELLELSSHLEKCETAVLLVVSNSDGIRNRFVQAMTNGAVSTRVPLGAPGRVGFPDKSRVFNRELASYSEDGFELVHIEQPAGPLQHPLTNRIETGAAFEQEVAAVFKLVSRIPVSEARAGTHPESERACPQGMRMRIAGSGKSSLFRIAGSSILVNRVSAVIVAKGDAENAVIEYSCVHDTTGAIMFVNGNVRRHGVGGNQRVVV